MSLVSFIARGRCIRGGPIVKLTTQTLDKMQSVNIGAVAADKLPDAGSVPLDSKLPREERLARFLRLGINPYCFSVGGVGVKIEFDEAGPSLQDTLTDFLIRQRAGL